MSHLNNDTSHHNQPQTKGETHEMKLKITITGLLILLFTFPLALQARADSRGSQSLLQLSPSNCQLKSLLPGVFFAPFECSPCCESSAGGYLSCRSGGKGICQCIQAAYDDCLDGGCGPCQCCADWLDRGQTQGCVIIHVKDKVRS